MRPRAWRITMWTGLAATVLLAGGAIGSRAWYGWWADRRGRYVGISGGDFVCGCVANPKRTGWVSDWSNAGPGPWWGYESAGPDWTLDVSLWLPAGATFAVSTLSAIMVYRRRHLFGHCPCGYDRSGLPTDAPCPECGKTGV